jgi:hypothetical protein
MNDKSNGPAGQIRFQIVARPEGGAIVVEQ